MKNILFSIFSISVMLLVGCQENSITDPQQGAVIQKNVDPTVQQGTIKLEAKLVNPDTPEGNYLLISGSVEFEETLNFTDAMPPISQLYISLRLFTIADISNPAAPYDAISTVSSESNDMISVAYVDQDGLTYINKYYSIKGKYNRLSLVCRFSVRTDGVSLSGMWLEAVNYDTRSNKFGLSNNENTYPPVVENHLSY